MSAGTVIVPLRPGSDGDPTHVPDLAKYTLIDPPNLYLEKIGNLWMESRGEALPGVKYILERLPNGYDLYQKPRTSDPKIVDRWLFGHPNHKAFDSPNRFFPHFKYLMDNGGDSMGCQCTVCQAKGSRVPNIGSARKPRIISNGSGGVKDATIVKQKGRPKLLGAGQDTGRVDEEGTPDVYRNLIDKLKRTGTVDEPIQEPMSLDWRAEQEIMPGILQKYRSQPQWVPRVGDLLLFVRRMGPGEEICQDDESGEFKIYNHGLHSFTGFPHWEAGVVGQAPAESVNIEDLVVQTQKETNVNQSGVRVEPLPDPNGTAKSLSKKYKYVPLHYTRPFVFWKEFLDPIPAEEWHPTIKNALTVMSSFSLMGKHRFAGKWPSAKIYCHGIYIGSESIVSGDVVRLMPRSGTQTCVDVLQIQSIQLKLSNLHLASNNDMDEGRPYNSVVHIIGKAFTLDQPSTHGNGIKRGDTPPVLDGYENWYPLHGPSKAMEVPFTRVLGRCFEADAMVLLFSKVTPSEGGGQRLIPNLGEGLEGARKAREFSSTHYKKITDNFGRLWFWGDSRKECLDVDTLNGLELGDRDPATWRKWIKTMDDEDREGKRQSMLEQRGLREYLAPGLVRSKSGDVSSGTEATSGMTRESSALPTRKRSHGIESRSESAGAPPREDEESGEEDESPVESLDAPDTQRKKSKVMVVID